jgi:hypothetical protein
MTGTVSGSPNPYPDDPDAPYFEHLYGVLKMQRPDLTRSDALAIVREIDPEDRFHISLPLGDPRADDPEDCHSEMIDGLWTYCGCADCRNRQHEDEEGC